MGSKLVRYQATEDLTAHVHGDEGAAAGLLPLVYQELRALAASYLREERAGISLQPTDLVHEAYLKLIDLDRIDWQERAHFFAMAATQMRRVLPRGGDEALRRAGGQGGCPLPASVRAHGEFCNGTPNCSYDQTSSGQERTVSSGGCP